MNRINKMSTRLIIIADRRMDWAARFTIASARINSHFKGEIVMIGECAHPEFDQKMEVEYHDWYTASKGLLPDSPWGAFRKPQIKPFLIRKYFKESTVFLDADIYCLSKFDHLIENINSWACATTKDNPNILNAKYMKLWGIDESPTHQLNSGVLFIREKCILDQWCSVFEEALTDPIKFDYLMYRQPWSYDQIGLIIAAARLKNFPENLEHTYNYEVASKGWHGVEKASIIHFTNWKVYNFQELLCLENNAPINLKMAEIGSIVQQIEETEDFQPALMTINNSNRSKKATGFLRKKINKRLIVGISKGIGEIISATPMLQALLNMGWQVDLPNGVFEHNADKVVEGLGVRIINYRIAKEEGPYTAALQSVWPVRGIERLSNQSIYADNCEKAWKCNLFVHQVEANMSLAYALGYNKEIPPLYCYKENCNKTEFLLALKKPIIGISFENDGPLEQNSINDKFEYTHILSDELIKRNYHVIILGNKTEDIKRTSYPIGNFDLSGQLNLPQIAFAISKMSALITDNYDISHVAAAMDIPQISISKDMLTVKNRPWSNKAQVINFYYNTIDPKSISINSEQSDIQDKILRPECIARKVERLIKHFGTQ